MNPICMKCDVSMVECPVTLSGYAYLHIDFPSGRGVRPFAYVCPRCGLVQLYVKIRKKEK